MSANANNIARRIAPLFGFSTERMLECMTALQQGKSDAFYEELAFLEEENIGNDLGKGEFGMVKAHKTITNRVFKYMSRNPCILMSMMEAFIQAVLCTEPGLGINICKLFHVYQSLDGVVIEIEELPDTLDSYIQNTIKKKGQSETKVMIRGMRKELEDVIRALQDRLQFQHSDLHLKNIMIKDNHIKLIDFGFSRIIIDGKVYTTNKTINIDPTLNLKRAARDFLRLVGDDEEYPISWGGKRQRQIKRRTTRPKKRRSTRRRRR